MGHATRTYLRKVLKTFAKALFRKANKALEHLRQTVFHERRLLSLEVKFWRLLRVSKRALSAEKVLLHMDLSTALRTKDLIGLLRVMGAYEVRGTLAPIAAGRWIADLVSTEAGRAELLPVALAARADHPQSAWLTHLITLCQAMDGEYRTAGKDLADRLKQPFDAKDPLARRRFEILRNSWRITDQAAREHMDWIDEDPDYAKLVAPAPTLPGAGQPLGFKEHLLQGRKREEYLAACDVDFMAASSLNARVRAIEEMIRPSLRPSPSYASSFAQAKERLESLGPEIADHFAQTPESGRAGPHIFRTCRLLSLARKLADQSLIEQCCASFEALSKDPQNLPAFWPALAEVAEIPERVPQALSLMERVCAAALPKTDRDISRVFRWALLTNMHEVAEELFETLSKGARRQTGVLQYVHILARQGRFSDAMECLREIHARALAHPRQLNAFTSRSLIKRRGELAFLIKTAEVLGAVPQPQKPKGLVLLTARNLDHLRRTPLMVLRQLKAEGWAVIPLVSGLLPYEPTRRPEIDLLNGAISPNIRLSSAAKAAFPTLTGFSADLTKGRFDWDGIELSHPLWEDAAIARRRYHVDWECPELMSSMGNLVAWTKAMGQALEYAQTLDLPIANLVILPARLPDAAIRLYCEEKGDPEQFYCLHGANGYQNYFTNFSTNISERYVLRNLTAYPATRAAAMPVPAYFERYYSAAKPRLADIRARFATTAATPRSTQGKPRPPEANALLEELKTWRAGGGKIACAFGKVVCDSSVPFDGGPAHSSMEDWIQHACRAVAGSDTLLLIKPHPHEINNRIATFPTEYFADLLSDPLPVNVRLLGHRWFDIADIAGQIDLGLIYNGTTAVELGLMGVPCLLSGHFAPIDYPIGHVVPQTRAEFEAYLRFEKTACIAPDLADRAAVWLDYMASEDFTLPYRYHVRTVTNTVLYPPWWYEEDLRRGEDDPAIAALTARALNRGVEPGEV